MWARGEPTRYGTCVAMNSRTGHWNIVSCKKRRIMICKVALGNWPLPHSFFIIVFSADFDYGARQTDTKKTSKKSCRKDEEQFRKACYYVSKEGKFVASQGQAHRINCRDRGAELASLSSISEHFFIAKESSGLKGSTYWIGLVFNRTSRQFTWLHGLPATFTKWAKYEPAYTNGECVTFGFDGLDFGWSVANCSTTAGYICKSKP